MNKNIEKHAYFVLINTYPRFPPFFTMSYCKLGVTFAWICFCKAKKINVLFPEMSPCFLGLIGGKFFVLEFFLHRKKHENRSKYLKNRRKILRCLNKI